MLLRDTWLLRHEWHQPAEWTLLARCSLTRFTLGFTLLELLVVLMLASVLLTLTLPALNAGMARLELTSATRDVASALRTARRQAMVSRRAQSLFLDVEQRRYRLSHLPRIYALPTSIDLHLWTVQSESRGESVAGITFFPDGSATGGRITVKRGAQQHVIDVRWLTGQVTIVP